jgi:hypothetical protein
MSYFLLMFFYLIIDIRIKWLYYVAFFCLLFVTKRYFCFPTQYHINIIQTRQDDFF